MISEVQLNQQAIDKLNSFRRLNYSDWNGYGCEPWYVGEKSEEYIRQVVTLIRTLPYTVQIFPLQGTHIVQIEYEDSIWYIEFELNEDHAANVYEQAYPLDEDIEYKCYWWEIPSLIGRGGKNGWGNPEVSQEKEERKQE